MLVGVGGGGVVVKATFEATQNASSSFFQQ